MKKDKEFDDIFKKGLGEPVEPEYREQDWNALEQMLDGNKKRRGIIFWLPILSSAAILLIALGWWVLRPDIIKNEHQRPQIAMRRPIQQTDVSKGKVQNTPQQGTTNRPGDLIAKNGTVVIAIKPKKNSANQVITVVRSGINTAYQPNINKAGNALTSGNETPVTNSGSNKMPVNATEQRQNIAILAAVNPALPGSGNNSPTIDSVDVKHLALAANKTDKHSKVVTKSIFLSHPRYALSVIAAPEVNGVGSFEQTSSGTNVGLLFSAGLFKKITFSAGALYSKKPYSTYFSNYYGGSRPGSNLSSINADCRVLDIPLNMDFQFYHKNRNSFSVGSGLSSYIMLHESYQYNYTNPAVNGSVNYTVPNTNKYIFGVLNLQATYTRQMNSAVGLSIQPYMKVPLTGIGANNAKLQTAGVAVGLSWNLNSLSKP
jgi:hypothetical protein